VIDVRAARPPAGNTFEALFSAYRKADQRGDTDGALKAWREIRRVRIERNIRSLEALALATVANGLDRLAKGERDRAEEDFNGAMSLDPHLPDAYFAMALSEMKKVPLGIVPAISDTVSGLTARMPTIRGRQNLRTMLVPVMLLSVFVAATVFATVMVLSHGTLLLHDLEETFGVGGGRWPWACSSRALNLPWPVFQGAPRAPVVAGPAAPVLERSERFPAASRSSAEPRRGGIKDLEARILTEQNPFPGRPIRRGGRTRRAIGPERLKGAPATTSLGPHPRRRTRSRAATTTPRPCTARSCRRIPTTRPRSTTWPTSSSPTPSTRRPSPATSRASSRARRRR
jgi:hypothetical protein